MNLCDNFRAALAAHLESGTGTPRELGLDGHVATCAECRFALENEEVLELWLQQGELAGGVPAGLVARILAALESERDLFPLGPLLGTVPAPNVPAGLAQRVLEGVRSRVSAPAVAATGDFDGPGFDRPIFRARSRAALVAAANPAVVERFRRRTFVLAAVALFLGILTTVVVTRGIAPTVPVELEAALDDPSDELLANLDMLEDWELLAGTEDDVYLVVGALDEFDLWLLELAAAQSDALVPEFETTARERG